MSTASISPIKLYSVSSSALISYMTDFISLLSSASVDITVIPLILPAFGITSFTTGNVLSSFALAFTASDNSPSFSS